MTRASSPTAAKHTQALLMAKERKHTQMAQLSSARPGLTKRGMESSLVSAYILLITFDIFRDIHRWAHFRYRVQSR